jgi:hypothetical protein
MSVLDLVRNLRKGLELQPADLDVRKLFPMFAPARFFNTGGWPGPFVLPGADGVGVTWALDLPAGAMRYLDNGMRKHWEATGVDWKAAALANLADASKERLFTHGLPRKNGELFAVAMMHPDGWGPSRLFLREALQQVFPRGYRVSIPEMSCGLAMSRELEGTEEATIQEMIAKCFGGGTRPLAPGIFEPDEILPNWAAA